MAGPRIDVNDVLVTERGAFLELLHGLEPSEWEAPTECPAWTVKGIALHVLGDDLSLLSRQRDGAMPGVFVFAETHPGLGFRELLDGFNEQWVEAAQFLSTPMVLELLRLSGDWTSDFYSSVDLDSLGEPVGFFAAQGPSPYWQIAAREYVERWVHHHQILRATGRPDLGAEFLGPAAAVVVRGLAAHLPDLDATPGTRIGITVSSVARWTLTREGDSWMVSDGLADDAAVELVLDEAAATPILSRARSAADARAAYNLFGDRELGERVLGVIGVMVDSGQ
jgi:uncharacterized protein (TIGR03083 family)